MKKILIATVGVLGLAATTAPASAADMRIKAPVYKAPIVDPWNWSGFYVGLNVGYSWGRSASDASLRNNTTSALLFTAGPGFDLDGWIGGGQIGYNWQVATWVFGLEADLQASGQKGGTSIVCGVLICNPLADTFDTNTVRATLDQRLAWFGTVRARLGATLAPTVLAYVTGGLAYGRIDSDGTFSGFTRRGSRDQQRLQQQHHESGLDGRRRPRGTFGRQLDREDRVSLHRSRLDRDQHRQHADGPASSAELRFPHHRQHPAPRHQLQIRLGPSGREILTAREWRGAVLLAPSGGTDRDPFY